VAKAKLPSHACLETSTSNPSPLKEPTARAGSAALAARKGREWLRLPLQCYHTTRAVRPPNPTSPASSNPFRPKKAALGGHGYLVGTNQELCVILMSMVLRLFASSCHNAYTSVLIHGQRDSSIASCWLLCILPCDFKECLGIISGCQSVVSKYCNQMDFSWYAKVQMLQQIFLMVCEMLYFWVTIEREFSIYVIFLLGT
jgi:hypothetical protein